MARAVGKVGGKGVNTQGALCTGCAARYRLGGEGAGAPGRAQRHATAGPAAAANTAGAPSGDQAGVDRLSGAQAPHCTVVWEVCVGERRRRGSRAAAH